MINIKGKNKAQVLAALYNAAQPLGMGILHFVPGDMPVDDAQVLLNEGQTYFDYLHGRLMKVDLAQDVLDERLYDRDNGPGAAEAALRKARLL